MSPTQYKTECQLFEWPTRIYWMRSTPTMYWNYSIYWTSSPSYTGIACMYILLLLIERRSGDLLIIWPAPWGMFSFIMFGARNWHYIQNGWRFYVHRRASLLLPIIGKHLLLSALFFVTLDSCSTTQYLWVAAYNVLCSHGSHFIGQWWWRLLELRAPVHLRTFKLWFCYIVNCSEFLHTVALM